MFSKYILCFAFIAISYATSNTTYINETKELPLLFEHNFCESRLQNNEPPELFNAYTSLAITTYPFIMGFPKHLPFINVAYALAVNGFASFYYHYHLNWIGKQADEISMIFANYYGLHGLIILTNQKNIKNKRFFQFLNIFYMYLFLIINTIIKYDKFFPYLFSIYLLPTLYLIRKVAKKNNEHYIKYLLTSFVGALCWIISEIHCTKHTQYGHVLWHFLFPLGFYKIVLNYDLILDRLINYHLISNSSDNF
tara:strand:+ start:1947 stop:2702 length:756 start_codon:yes stop_codon:yes gene_type:complete